MKRILSFTLAIAFLLSACGSREGPPSSSYEESLPVSSQEETAAGELPALPPPSEETAKALTNAVLQQALLPGAAEGWHGEEELLDLLTFALCVPFDQEHPYQEWFPIEGEGLRCYPREATSQMLWEVFGVPDWEFSREIHCPPLEWNEEKDRFQSDLGHGVRWPAFEAMGEMTAAWQDSETITVTTDLSEEGDVNGDPGFLPLGKAVFTYRRMTEGQRDFLRLISMEIQRYEVFRYDTIPGMEMPQGPFGKLICEDKYIGEGQIATEPDTIAAVLDLLEQIQVYDTPDDPPDGQTQLPDGMYFQFFSAPEDETPAFTVYFSPFCVEVGGNRSDFYRINDTSISPKNNFNLVWQMYSEAYSVALKFPREGKRLFQIPFQGNDGARRTVNLFLPEDWTAQGNSMTGPEGETLTITAYSPGSPVWETLEDSFSWENQWISGRNYWPVSGDSAETAGVWQASFYENGFYYSVTLTWSPEAQPPSSEEIEEMLWDMVYIQERRPDEMADVVLEEQSIQ